MPAQINGKPLTRPWNRVEVPGPGVHFLDQRKEGTILCWTEDDVLDNFKIAATSIPQEVTCPDCSRFCRVED